ncbi:MAG: FG-GAP-like repeat-containing protein, partial [Bacteroidota bacterium]
MKRFSAAMKLHSLYVLPAMIVNMLILEDGLSGTDAMSLQTFSGQPLNAAFGQSVAIAGDVNGDGYGDLVIGALYNGEGRVYLFFGGAPVDTIPDVILNYRMSNDRFGACVAGAGDMNNDGYADVIVGARISGPTGLDSGHVYIFFGGALMDSVPDVIMAGLPRENFGGSVAGAGDVNGDGYADVIVGANGSDAAGLDVGRAYIFFGGATVDNIPDVIITGTVITENLGYSVASAGDVNNDGYDDVIVGAYANDLAGGNNSGKAYLYLGGSPMNNVVDVTFNGSAAFDYFGVCVAGAGDVNNDGYDDVLISSTENSNRGRTSLFLGGASMNNIADVTFFGQASNNNFGRAAAAAGDLNQDGYADVIIGAYANSQVGAFAGKTYVYCGGASMDTIPDLTFLGEAAYDYFGVSVAGSGDVNGDGFGDVIVGSNNGGVTDKGRAYLYFSTDGPLPIQLASFTATLTGQRQVR